MKILKKGKIKKLKDLVNLPEFFTETYGESNSAIVSLKFLYDNNYFYLPAAAIDNYVGKDMTDNFGLDLNNIPEFLLDTAKWVNDWSKVKVDTKVLVSDDGKNWKRRYFAKEINNKAFVWPQGRTSWTMSEGENIDPEYIADVTEMWGFVKIFNEEE